MQLLGHGCRTVGRELTGRPSERVSQLMPEEQASYWINHLSQTDLADLSPEELMGAAVVLDSPSNGYLSRWAAGAIVEFGQQQMWDGQRAKTMEFWIRCRRLATLGTTRGLPPG